MGIFKIKSKNHTFFVCWLFLIFLTSSLLADSDDDTKKTSVLNEIEIRLESFSHRLDMLEKALDDMLWYHRLSDISFVDKVRHVGPPPAKVDNPTAMGAKNPVVFYSYVFIPRNINYKSVYPLLVFPHGGVHSNFNTYYVHIVRELVVQGYVVVAPEYRGSTGYGKEFFEMIDYGGLEINDVDASREYMITNYSYLDANRVGILGWSHGGLIALMNIFNFPQNYRVAFAGVPVSDLVARMGYMTEEYRKLYSAKYHIGKTANQDVESYRKRSPVWNTDKLQTPLLIHTNTSDEDVNVLEVEHLIKSLKASNKKFEYEIFENIPGGHGFDRLDTLIAKKIRFKIYKFLENYLDPPNPFNSLEDLLQASYQGF